MYHRRRGNEDRSAHRERRRGNSEGGVEHEVGTEPQNMYLSEREGEYDPLGQPLLRSQLSGLAVLFEAIFLNDSEVVLVGKERHRRGGNNCGLRHRRLLVLLFEQQL